MGYIEENKIKDNRIKELEEELEFVKEKQKKTSMALQAMMEK